MKAITVRYDTDARVFRYRSCAGHSVQVLPASGRSCVSAEHWRHAEADDADRDLRGWAAEAASGAAMESPGGSALESPGRSAVESPGRSVIGCALGSGTLIAYLSLADAEAQPRLSILTVLTETGDQVAGPQHSEPVSDYEASVIMTAAAETDDPIGVLRQFLTFRPDRGVVALY